MAVVPSASAPQAERSVPDVLFTGQRVWSDIPMTRPAREGRWAVEYTVEGRGRYQHPDRIRFSSSQGDLVLLRRDAPVSHGSPGDRWRLLFLRFEPWPGWMPPAPAEKLADGFYRVRVALPRIQQRIQEAWGQIIADAQSRDAARVRAALRENRGGKDPDAQDAIWTGLMLGRLREIFLLVEQDALAAARLDSRIAEALRVMKDDLSSPHDIATLAERVSLSPAWFAHLFRAEVGLPPLRALRLLRLNQAALRLRYSDDLVGTIAEETGFSSIYDFSRQFQRTYGMCPRAYRRARLRPSSN